MVLAYEEINRKTRAKIQRALLTNLESKPLDKISVGDIAAVAGISRGTFYLHYLDKYDLIEQTEQTFLEGLHNHLHPVVPKNLLEEAAKGRTSEAAVNIFCYIDQEQKIFKTLLKSGIGFHKKLKIFFIDYFEDKMTINEDFFKNAHVSPEYLSAFATSAFLGLIETWIEGGLSETPEEMAETYLKIIFFIKNL